MHAKWGVIVCSVLLLVNGPAWSDDQAFAETFIGKKFSLWMGGFFPKVHSTVRIDTPDFTPGDTIDFEDTLGLEDGKNVGFGGVRWRFNPKHQLEAEVIQLNRSSLLEAVSEDLGIGDYEVRVGARIESKFHVTVGRLTYGYNLLNSRHSSLYLKVGAHIADFDTALRLSGNVFKDGVPIDDQGLSFVDEGAAITAPLPHLGASWAYAFSDHFAVRAQGLAFALKIDDWSGYLLDFGLDLQYHPWKHFGFGAGMRYFKTTVENDDQGRKFGKFVYEYYGPVVYGVFSF